MSEPQAAATPREAITYGNQTYEFAARDKVKKLSEVREDGAVVIKFLFRNGEAREAIFAPGHPVLGRAAQHGLDQKLGDDFAGVADIEDCIEAFEQMAERLQAGEWTAPAAAGSASGVSLLAAALMELTGKTKEQVRDALKALTPKVKSALSEDPAVAPIIGRIKAERESRRKTPAETVDTAGLLASLRG